MKNIFVLIPNENWIVDRIGNEFCHNSRHIARMNPFDCDIIWLAAPWCWKNISWNILRNKKVVCSIHHEVPEKFIRDRMSDFLERDEIVDHYIVPCQQTYDFISKYTDRPITKIGYWWNSDLWYSSTKDDVVKYRDEFGLKHDEYVIGSFQRDTEGSDLVTPKLEKGPDILCDYIKMLSDLNEKKIHVLLGGWRRQYVVNRLIKDKIKFTYSELPSLEQIRKMYSACDLYVSTSRYEGGPQCLFEATAVGTNIIASNVGMASECLHNYSIVSDFYCENSYKVFTEVHNCVSMKKIEILELKNHIKKYDDLFEVI